MRDEQGVLRGHMKPREWRMLVDILMGLGFRVKIVPIHTSVQGVARFEKWVRENGFMSDEYRVDPRTGRIVFRRDPLLLLSGEPQQPDVLGKRSEERIEALPVETGEAEALTA